MKVEDVNTLSALVGAVGTDQLGATLDAVLRHTLDFDMSCVYLFRFNHNAVLIHDGYNASVPATTLSAYLRGGYLLDPFYVACTNDHPAGLWRMSDLAPDSFYTSGFSISKDIHPCVSSSHGTLIEELGFIIPIHSRVSVVYSLMRSSANGVFHEHELTALKALAPMINSLVQMHCRLQHPECYTDTQHSEAQSEDAFVDILQGQLTETQRYIAKLVLQGHSNASVADVLRISEGTVKVHKHNIYQRLNISNNSDLFRLFIGYLTREG